MSGIPAIMCFTLKRNSCVSACVRDSSPRWCTTRPDDAVLVDRLACSQQERFQTLRDSDELALTGYCLDLSSV